MTVVCFLHDPISIGHVRTTELSEETAKLLILSSILGKKLVYAPVYLHYVVVCCIVFYAWHLFTFLAVCLQNICTSPLLTDCFCHCVVCGYYEFLPELGWCCFIRYALLSSCSVLVMFRFVMLRYYMGPSCVVWFYYIYIYI